MKTGEALLRNTLRLILILGLALAMTASHPGTPDAYPPDPTADIPWSSGISGVVDIQSAFNAARTAENAQLGLALPAMTLPSQATWNTKTDNEKALWLINQERTARGVAPLHGTEANVTSVAQYYANYLLTNDVFGHEEDGRDPWERLNANPAIGACHDFLNVAENLSVFVTSGSSIPLPVERSVYGWMYDDAGSGWGHRHAILWYPYNDNSGTAGMEGFVGIGRAEGGPYQGPFSNSWPTASIVVMNVFDPCSSWNYGSVTPPGAFNKSSPANGATNRPLNTSISWGASSGATSYDYCYDTSNDNACANWINITATSTALGGLASGTTYYWQVRAKNTGGTTYANGSSTTFWSFKTLVTAPQNKRVYLALIRRR